MAYSSVIAAVIDRFDGFTFTGKPGTLFLDGVSVKTAAGAVSLPTVNLTDHGTTTEYDFEHYPVETTTFVIGIRAASLTDADAIAAGIRYNGGSITAGSGLDYAASLSLTGMELLSVERKSEKRSREQARDPNANPVYLIELTYEAVVRRTSS